MKVLICCSKLSGGGAERVAVSWADGLSRRGFKVRILTDLGKPIIYKTIDEVEIKDFEYNFGNGIFSKIKNRIHIFRRIKSEIKEFKPNVIILVEYTYPIEFYIISKICGKCPVILTDHNAFERPSTSPMSVKMYLQKFYLNRIFNKVTCLTNVDKNILNQHKIKNVSVLHNPLFLRVPNNLENIINSKGKIVLAAGRINEWHTKGFDVLINAWNKIAEAYPDWQLQIMGQGTDENINYLISLSKYPDSIKFLGQQNNVQKYYERSSIFVLSSRYEGWGLVLVEAMSQGCAAVACDFNGRQSEIIKDGINGLLCIPDDIEQLADEISHLIADPNLRKRIQKEAASSVTQFYEDNVAMNLESVIFETLKP